MDDKLHKLYVNLTDDGYNLGTEDEFRNRLKDKAIAQKFHSNMVDDGYQLGSFDEFVSQTGLAWGGVNNATNGTGVQAASAGEMVAQGTQAEQPAAVAPQQTTVQAKPGTVQQQATPTYSYTYFDESAIDPDEGELRMSMKPANWAYSERVNKSRGSHTKDNSPILRMSLDGDQLDIDAEREALVELKGMTDEEIYKYTNGLYNLTWGELTNEQRRDAASRLAAAGYELHVRDLGLGHAGDVSRSTDEVQTNLQDPKYRKLYDQGQWADPVDALSRQYDTLFNEQATKGGTMGQQQATKMANRVLRAANKDQMFTWALQEAERTGGDPYKIYENIYDRFHAAVKEKLGAYNTRGQAAGLLGDIDAMIAEKYSAAEEEDRASRSGFSRILYDAMNADRGVDPVETILMNDPDMSALRYAKRTIEGVNNLIAEADHNAASGNFAAWLESSFAGGAARGFGQAVFDVRTWDMGFGDVRDATALMTALDKSDKGIPLSRAEQAMLDAKAVELAAHAYFSTKVGMGYEVGKVTGESLPFMLEMMINPASRAGGLAVNKLVRYALKRFPQRGAAAVERQAVRAAERQAVRSAERRATSALKGKILESAGLVLESAGKKTVGGKVVRAVAKTAGNVAGSAVMAGTTGLPGVVADTQRRMIGQLDYDVDETGAAHVTGHGFGVPMIEAFKDALVARGIENVTEMSEFDVLTNWLGGLTRKTLDKLHMGDVYKFFDDIKMSDVAKVVDDFEKKTHWQGTIGEYFEEVEGGILNAWLVGDQTLDTDPETGVFNADNNVKTFLGVSLLGGVFSTVQTVGYRTPKARMRKDIEDADKQASELWGGTWQQFKNSVDGADDEEMEVLLANIVVNNNYSVDQRRAAAQYIKSVVAYRGAMKGEEIRAVDGESNPESEQSFEHGYQAQGEEREEIDGDLKQAEQRLTDMGFDMGTFEGWTGDKFEAAIKGQDHGYSDEELEVIRSYFRAKAASDGISQRVEDDIDKQVQQASDLVDKQTNQGTGMVHRAVLNNGQEVYVTGGQLVMTGDGTMVDTEASDESLFVYNPATGKPEQYTPQDFQSVDDPISPEQLKSEAARDIRMSVEQQAQDDKNGVLPFQVGDTYEILVDGQPATVTVVEDMGDNVAVQRAGSPEAEIVPKQQIQAAASAMKQAKRSAQMPATLPTRGAGARDNAAAATTGRVNNATDGTPAAPAAQAPALPMDEKTGEPVWLQTTPEQGYSHLAQSGMTPEDIGTMIDDRIAQADAAIAKASKGGTIDERLAARKAKDYWENVKRLHDAAKTAAEQRPTGQTGTNGRGTTAAKGAGTTAPVGAVRVEAGQSKTMPVGYVAVNIDGTRAEDRGQMGIRAEDEAYFLKTMSPRVMRLLDKVAKSLGWKIRLYNGVNANERGMFSNGTVWVNRRAMTSKLAQWILGHEMTHGMAKRTGHGETFKAYVKLANEYKRRQMGDKQYEKELQSLIKAYQKHLKSLDMDPSIVDRAYIEEEYACDVTGDLLMNNPEMIGKLFSGVDSPGKKKGIVDMIVDFLNYLKSKLPWRSEERQALDDLSKRLNNLYRDAKAQTAIAKATAREEGSQIEEDGAEGATGSFSITGNAEGTGFTASETVLEIWRVPQEDGTYKEEEHWVKKPLLDSEGNVVFRIDGKEFSVNNPITVEDLKSNPDTALNYMLADALRAGTINEVKADQVRQQYADMLNLYLEKGAATKDGNGFENLEKKWLWVGETVFRTVASNSDEQYSYSIDITKVCKKNEAVIRAISALQVKTGYGVTPGQILDIYEETDAEGFQVPCPVCYVFSRYINNGKYATAIVNGMKKYGKHLPGQPEEWTVEQWVAEMNDAKDMADKMKTPLKHANEDVKLILQEIDTLSREITSGKLSEEEAESKRRHVRALDERYRAALDVISQEAIPRWIKSFVLEGSEQSGWRMREDAALPEDMDDFTLHALDIRMTASAMEKYPSLTRYRRAGGSAGGKEVTFASNNELGSIIMGLGIAKDKLDDYPNYYQLAAEAATEEERQALLKKASERFDKARLYAQRQTLRGGQRMWSWSDNIESLSSDVASNLMQLELLGGAMQTYSKQLEGVKMVAAMNGYVNASLMGYGNGVQEVSLDDTIEVGPDKKRYLKNDIKNVSNKGRERIIANGYDPETRTGTPVYYNEADGKYYVLVFDDVVGIDPFGHNGKRGLFSLNEEYDRAGNILVGMNDIHVRAAMADPRVFFIIPWHASGMHNHILKQMFALLGANLDNSTDYTKMQEETNFLERTKEGKLKNKVSKDMEDFWDSHSYEDEFACGTGHIENGDHQGGLSESQLHYRELRDAIFDGTVDDEDKAEWKRQVEADEFLSQVYRMVHKYVDDGKMTEKDKEFIYPYEYWQTTEIDENGNEVPARVEHADVNGRRYMEYCRRMGFKPKFSGKYDEDAGYSPEGDFTSDPGYWKVLIDRRMYDRRGNYQELTPIDSSGLDSSMYDPDQTKEEFNVTEVATNAGAENIADTVYRDETERTGTMPTPNLDMTMDEAVAKYNEVTALQASLIKAEREAIKAAEAAKVKMEKARAKEVADVDGRKAKSVARAKESARKAMEVARQKAREVEEIAGRFETVRDDIAQNGTDGEARFSLSTADDARFREVMREGGSLRIIRTENGYRPMVKDYDTGEWKSGAGSGGRWRIEGMPGEFGSRAAAINEWRERAAGNVVWSIGKGGRTIEVEGEGDMYQDMTGTDAATQQRWAQQRAEKGRAMVDELAESLGVEVRYVDDMTDEERADLSERQRRAKGWYDTRTGEVYINLGNHNRLYDILATAMHETVAHKGLRQLMGDRFDDFLDNVYNNVDKHIHNEIDRLAERNGGDVRAATEEYMAMLAERINTNSSNMANRDDMLAWERIKMWVLDMLREAGAKLTSLSDEDLRAILYESYHNMQREGAMGVAQGVAFRDQMEQERAAQNAAIPRPAGAVAEGDDVRFSIDPGAAAEIGDGDVRFSIRTKPAPKKTRKAYKLMRLVDGKLYPLFIGNNEEMKLHTWYDADSPALDMLTSLEPGDHLLNMETGETMTWDEYAEQHVPKDKNGKPKRGKPNVDDIHWANENGLRFMHIEDKAGSRSENDARKKYGDTRLYYNWGINGSKDSENGEGSASLYALRPGLHTGAVCSMPQIGYDNPDGGTMRLDNQVWVEVEMADDVDYQSEAESNASRDIPTHIPVDGNYRYATNPTQKKSKSGDTETDKQKGDWYVTGAMKITKILSDEEADEVVRKYNKEHGTNIPLDYRRRGGRVFNAETMQLEEVRDGAAQYSDNEALRYSIEERDGLMGEANAMQKVPGREVQQRAVDLDDVRFSLSRSTRETIGRWFDKRDDLSGEQKEAVMQYLDEFDDKKLQLAAARWYVNGTVRLPEDMPKVEQAVQVANKVKVDPLQYSSPMELINQFPQTKIKAKPIDPETVPTLHNGRDVGHGIRIYDVEESEESRQNMRQIINTHFGEDASPWCLLQGDGEGNLTEDSKYYWDKYKAYPKQVAFQNGKLVAFSANDRRERVWWDRMDNPTSYLVIEEPVQNDKLNRVGEYQINPKDGAAKMVRSFKGNKQNGKYEEWDEKDQRKLVEHYKGGKLDGVVEYYDMDRMVRRMQYKAGRFDGVNESFYIDGEIKDRSYFINGKRNGLVETWNKDGVLTGSHNYKDGKKDGESLQYYDDGSIKSKESYKDGNLHGTQEYYSESGQLRGRLNYSNGKSDGTEEYWYENGNMSSRDVYRGNVEVGPVESWYENGNRKRRIELNRYGEYDGVSEMWAEDGTPTYRGFFKDGTHEGEEFTVFDTGSMEYRVWERDNLLLSAQWNKDGKLVSYWKEVDGKEVRIRPEDATDIELPSFFKEVGQPRFSIAPTFYSNAAKAVEGVKQEKATAEQWKAMLTKQGGIKAGEDKWMGLSTWLDEHKGETLTKDEVRKFVADNGIEMEEVNYGDKGQGVLDKFQDEFKEIIRAKSDEFRERGLSDGEAADEAFEEMVDRYGDDFDMAFMTDGLELIPIRLPNGHLNDAAKYFLGVEDDTEGQINETRLEYTTHGLENKREIAFVVPGIEPYQEHDEIHFGPENQGRAVMWVRFGETTDTDGNRVLVIDEVQSNRHQDAREKGYADPKAVKAFNDWMDAKAKEFGVQPYQVESRLSDEEYHKMMELANAAKYDEGAVPAAPFEKNWHEVAMKRMLRLAAKEGFDKVAWTTGKQQNDRYNLATYISKIEKERRNASTLTVDLTVRDTNGLISFDVDKDGIITHAYQNKYSETVGKPLADVIGKEVADEVLHSRKRTFNMDEMEIGGEGMKGFYDQILPRYMDKYGKRWGVKTGEVTLNTPGRETMHSVDVNEDMKRSVMQGQPLFSLSAEQQERQTHSENFKRWFGDWENDPEHASKVVDDQGRPLVVWHGTPAGNEFYTFERGAKQSSNPHASAGFWFGESEGFARSFVVNSVRNQFKYGKRDPNAVESRVIPAYISMKNPKVFETPDDAKQQEFASYPYDDAYRQFERDVWIFAFDVLKYRGKAINEEVVQKYVKHLKKQGYDGIIIKGTYFDKGHNGGEPNTQYCVFSSNQIKSAEPVTYDDNGNAIPSRRRFTKSNPDIRFSISTEEDRDYMDAVERGDTAKASRMVREAAKRAMPDTKVVDENGEPLVVYHTNREGSGFYEFDTSVKRNRINMGSHFGTEAQAANIARDGKADGNNPKTYAVYLDIKNPLEVTDFFADDNSYWANLLVKLVNENNIDDPEINAVIADAKEKWPWLDGNEDSLWDDDNYDQRHDSKYQFDDLYELYQALRDVAERLGYDGFVYYNQIEGDGMSYVAFHPEQIKSAEAVTRDDNGEVIPLSQRFDEGKKDIRFSLGGDGTVEEYNKAVNMTGRTFNVGGREVKPGITRYNFQEAFQDAILAVKKLQQVVERHFGIKLPTRENAWMYENRLSSINMHERKSFIEKVYEPMMKIADRIMKRGVKEKELNAYLICKHGLERNRVFAERDAQAEYDEIIRNGGTADLQQLIDEKRQRDYSGLTGVTGIEGDITAIEAEAQRIVDEFEQRHGALCNELWDAIRKATQWSLRKSYQSGMMSAATFNHVSSMFQYYIPLRGWSETTAEDVYSYMMGEHGAFNGVLKKAEGRTSVADDPLATIGNMAESALIQGNRNLLKQHLLRMAQNHPTDVCQVRDVWLVEGPGGVWEPHWPNIPEDATPDEIDQILQDHEADMQQLEASGRAKRVRNNLDIQYRIDPRHVPEHAVVAKVAGVDHVVYINGNPRAAQAINGQTGASQGKKTGFARWIDFIFGDLKRYYSSVLTSLNINFSGANFVRDLPHAYAMTFIKQGPLKAAEYIAKSFQVIPWVFKNQFGKTGTSRMDRYFQEFLASGAVTGYAHINDVDAWKADNKRRWARLSALGKARVAVPRALGEVISAIGWFSETLELIPRFTAFLTERQAGKDIATAAKAAKDITTNFNKKGSEVTPGVWGAVANTLRYMKMFFNPIVQGMYQFVDVASMGKENKWVGPRMVLATMHLPVLGAIIPYLNQFLLEALGGDDDDDYWLINEYTRRNNVCIFTGNGYVKIPIAPVFRELYGMGEVVATRHAGKADNEKTAIDLIDQLRTIGSVEGQSSYNEWSLARFLLPEHFAPFVDVMNNENFTGGPIYYDNHYKEFAPEYTKAKKSTWSPLVAASKWLNEMMGGDEDIAADSSGKWMNPAVWQHVITNVGGGFAQLAGDVVSGISDITEGKEIDASNIPIAKRFYSGSSEERANWARFGIYKDYEREYTKAMEKYQALDKRGLPLTERAAEVAKFAESHPKAAAIYAVWNGGIEGADIPQQLGKLGKDDPAYWDLVQDAVEKAEKAMNTGYARAWEQKRKDRPDAMNDEELDERFDKSSNDSIRHIMADEISRRAGSQDFRGRDAQENWSDKSVAAWEAYQKQRTSDDIKSDAELSNLLKVDKDEKDKDRVKYLDAIYDELRKIRSGKDATSRSAGVKGLGEGDDERVMKELRAARKQVIDDLNGGATPEQAYRNLERRTIRLGLRKKPKK